MSEPPFEHVVADQGSTVYGVVLAVASRPDAEEAWSETFLSVLRADPDPPTEADVEACLVTIARRKAMASPGQTHGGPCPSGSYPRFPRTGAARKTRIPTCGAEGYIGASATRSGYHHRGEDRPTRTWRC